MVAGLLAGAGHVASALAPHSTEFDGAAFASGAFFGVRSNTVGQGFERRFAAIDYKIKKQKLHREDMRDLIELTTARMHIYHLVGTLLLAFCMGWYTDTAMWQLPVWYSNLWLISNFSACSYLIMCVWLAMYASVAARSIGTRLLTSYARLAFPTKKELESIKKPIFFNVGDAFRSTFRRGSNDLDLPSQGPATCEGSEMMIDTEDDCQHFKRFLEELPRWLVYDTWARVCMSFGMNQMLNALSYFSMGQFWTKSPLAAIMSFISIHVLQFIVLWLDIGDLYQTWYDTFAIVFFSVLPAVLAVVLLLHEWWFGQLGKSVTVFVCFVSHAGWLWYLNTLFKHAGSQEGRFQPGNFANVLEWVQGDTDFDPDSVANSTPGDESPIAEPSKPLGPVGFKGVCETGIFGTAPATKSGLEGESPKKSRDKRSMDHDPPVLEPMNGGRAPGTWMASTTRKYGEQKPHVLSEYWLPVRLIKYLTGSTIGWWCFAGFVHSVVIEFDGLNVYKDFTGDDVIRPLKSKKSLANLLQWPEPSLPLEVQWPEPARLFKVASLFCSQSEVLVSSGYSMYALSEETSTPSRGLSTVKDGNFASVICGAHGCDALSPPDADGVGSWMLSPLRSDSEGSPVPVPHTWRAVAGSWIDCPGSATTTCDQAMLAGWDGSNIFIATLRRNGRTKSWSVHPQFQVDPVIGLCSHTHGSCGHEEVRRYKDVKALQLSPKGRVLLILLGEGAIDMWDLPQGKVSKVVVLGNSYTSMCYRGDQIYLSREGDSGPIAATMAMPPNVQSLLLPSSESDVVSPPESARAASNSSSSRATSARKAPLSTKKRRGSAFLSQAQQSLKTDGAQR
eukprot:TRINITY_DN13081_c2_g1_i1.p1 TRINITY_DN13081_c2_g1~~TRINITY_DN13081_c2_g1_i1.p1  ORF type:complete len:844 (-),score=87.91 TRINITY_DN13081_c2_g1_i1:261-2792(-)